jgi:LruC domain-containing protein
VAFSYASEYNEISFAYLHFVEWAESGGTLYTDWYTNTAAGYRDPAYIYTP